MNMHQNRALLQKQKVASLYQFSEPNTDQLEMFETSLPFGDTLNRENRWIRLAGLIDWHRFESIYAQTFSTTGRPGIRARYVLGSLILKHKLEVSDEELLLQLCENPYLQYFIGLERFSKDIPFDASTLTNVRKRLGDDEFKKFEQTIIDELVEKKILKPRNLQIDATVFESDITYPTDCGLLNNARQYCVKQIKKLGKVVGQKVRTYCRIAQKEYLSFSKKKRKTKKQVRKMQKKLLQYLRRNIKQVSKLTSNAKELGESISADIETTLATIEKIYAQQKEMYTQKKKSIEHRIVSLHRPYVRPIVRGKNGKDVEFGAKANLSLVGKFLFSDHISFDNFNEGIKLQESVEAFFKRFSKYPKYVLADAIYGTRENRRYLDDRGIRYTFKPLGRQKKDATSNNKARWRREKQKERNRIEGAIGNSKSHYDLGKVRARTNKTEKAWIQMALLSRNIMLAGKEL